VRQLRKWTTGLAALLLVAGACVAANSAITLLAEQV